MKSKPASAKRGAVGSSVLLALLIDTESNLGARLLNELRKQQKRHHDLGVMSKDDGIMALRIVPDEREALIAAHYDRCKLNPESKTDWLKFGKGRGPVGFPSMGTQGIKRISRTHISSSMANDKVRDGGH